MTDTRGAANVTEWQALEDFLLARFDEEKQRATRDECAWADMLWDEWTMNTLAERIRDDCAAKRKIVSRLEWTVADRWVAQMLALPYQDHPDWREVWRF